MVFVIGITGSSCSGKTTFAERLSKEIRGSIYLSQDSFYLQVPDDVKDLHEFNFDDPKRLDNKQLLETIKSIKEGNSYDVPNYNFGTGRVDGSSNYSNNNCEILIIEGLFLFYNPEVYDEFDLKIFIDTDLDICLSRRVLRDQVTHGCFSLENIIDRWNRDVKSAYNDYVVQWKGKVDTVINGNISNSFDINIEILKTYLLQKLIN